MTALAAALLGTALGGCTSTGSPTRADGSHSAAPDSYGTLPSFLPTARVQPDSVLVGRAGRAALTSEGDTVRVRYGAASVLATVSGPQVPGEGMPHEPDATTCTWVVTLADATGAVPVSVADFTTVDHLGHVFRPYAVAGHPPRYATARAGRSMTFELRAVMPTGEGLLRWAPHHGGIVAAWDFEVETD